MTPLSFYKCLSDETRLRMMLLIASEGELCVAELTAALNEIQPKISRHLAQLRNCDLLQDRRQGQWIFYSINPELNNWCLSVIQITLKGNPNYLTQNFEMLCSMENRPQHPGICC